METSGGIQASLGGRYAHRFVRARARRRRRLDAVEASLATRARRDRAVGRFRALITSPLVVPRRRGEGASPAVAEAIDARRDHRQVPRRARREPPPVAAARDHPRLPRARRQPPRRDDAPRSPRRIRSTTARSTRSSSSCAPASAATSRSISRSIPRSSAGWSSRSARQMIDSSIRTTSATPSRTR